MSDFFGHIIPSIKFSYYAITSPHPQSRCLPRGSCQLGPYQVERILHNLVDSWNISRLEPYAKTYLSTKYKILSGHLRPVVLPHRFIVLDAYPYPFTFREFGSTEEPYCPSFVQTYFIGLNLTPRANGDVSLGCGFGWLRFGGWGEAPYFVTLFVSKDRIYKCGHYIPHIPEIFGFSPCRWEYSSGVSSNLSTCETSVNWPVNEADGLLSTTYITQLERHLYINWNFHTFKNWKSLTP